MCHLGAVSRGLSGPSKGGTLGRLWEDCGLWVSVTSARGLV